MRDLLIDYPGFHPTIKQAIDILPAAAIMGGQLSNPWITNPNRS
jgi:hypothetical protein